MNNIIDYSVTSIAQAIRSGQVSSKEVVLASLERIQEVNNKINAVVQIPIESALRDADLADRKQSAGEVLGILHGVPFTVKDNLETKNVVCACGTEGLSEYMPKSDAEVVAKMKAAGGIFVGKTNVPELGMGYETDNLVYGRTNNPYDLTRTSGGSSGGEAAIIASGGSGIGICTDGGGSARWPAHCCGLVGFKPTTGRTPKMGHVPPPGGILNSLWQISLIARHVEDISMTLPLICGSDLTFSTTSLNKGDISKHASISQLRVAYYIDNGIVAPNANIINAIHLCINKLEENVSCIDKIIPTGVQNSHKLYHRLMSADGGVGIRKLLKSWGTNNIHQYTVSTLECHIGKEVNDANKKQLMKDWDDFRSEMNKFMEQYDVIICPVSTSTAVKHGDTYRDQKFPGFADMFSYVMTFNLLGWPCGTVRVGTSDNGLPIGVQVVGRPWQEGTVLSVLRYLENMKGWEKPSL
ncbi:MAG TPA: hypothetical protein DCL76_08250 [Chloroflexi bacterium]|nr:hypothetical protein [Chloroflexota bacterium]|tara:strand:+ start:50 stop:1453 length:1404 start_codon:yes stop_codon:yes gene_type:complete